MKIFKCTAPTFALLVRQLKANVKDHDFFEIDLDVMRIKGDLAVIQAYFKKPMSAKSSTLDWAKRAVKAGFPVVKIPKTLEIDNEFKNLVKNKGADLVFFD